MNPFASWSMSSPASILAKVLLGLLALSFTVSALPAADSFKRARTASSSLIPFPRVGRSVSSETASVGSSEGSNSLYFGQKRTALDEDDDEADSLRLMEKRQKLIPFPRIGKRQALIPFPRTGKRSGAANRLIARPAARSGEEEPEFIRLANGLTLLSSKGRNNNNRELRIVGKNDTSASRMKREADPLASILQKIDYEGDDVNDESNDINLMDKEDLDKYYDHSLGQRLGRAGRRHFPIPYPRVGKREWPSMMNDDYYYSSNASPAVMSDLMPWGLIPRARLGKKSAAPNMIPMARLGKREPKMIPMARLG